jgi:hypothetical protein
MKAKKLMAVALLWIGLNWTASATSYSWDGLTTSGSNSANGAWSTAGNWIGDTTPTFNSNTDLYWYDPVTPGSRLTSYINGNRTARSINFTVDADSGVAFKLDSNGTTGYTLTFSGGGSGASITSDDGAGGTLFIGYSAYGSIALADNLTIIHNGSGILTLSRPVGGAYAITNNGTGMVVFSNANMFTGGLVVNTGHVRIASSAATLGAGPVTINSGAVLDLDPAGAFTAVFTNNLTLADGATLSLKVPGTNSYDVLRGATTNTLMLNGTVSLNFTGNFDVKEGDQLWLSQLFTNWGSVAQGSTLQLAAIGLPGSLGVSISSGVVTIIASQTPPIALPEQYPIAMTYHAPGITVTNLTTELNRYGSVQIMGAVRDAHWDTVQTRYPEKIVLKQDAWGGMMDRHPSTVYSGHWLMKTGTKLMADCAATSTVLSVENARLLATSQADVNSMTNNNSSYLLIYRLNGSNQPDWSNAEHIRITAVDTNNNTITVQRAQWDSQALAFTNGHAVVARHMMYWNSTPGGQWQFNFSLQCPRGGSNNLTAAEWFARDVKMDIDSSGADGVEFDVARWQWGSLSANPMDCNNDLITDYGYIDGVCSFGLGGQVFVRELRKLLGPGKIIQMDSNDGIGQQRGWQYVNGCQMESFPNANDFSTFSEAFIHLRQYQQNITTLPNFSYPYVKTTTTTFGNVYENGENVDWHFRTGLAAALLTGMPSPFTAVANLNFDPADPDAGEALGTQTGLFEWDEYTGGSLNDWQWLGRPVGVATQILDNLSSTNLMASTVWYWRSETNFIATCLTNNSEYSAAITALDSVTNILPINTVNHYPATMYPKTLTFGTKLAIKSGFPTLAINQEYTIEFEACGNDSWNYEGQTFDKVPRALGLLTPQNDRVMTVLVNSNWTSYRLSFYVTTNSPLVFGASEQVGDVKIRNIKLYQGGGERWAREFDHGLVLLNMTKTPWTVNVGTGAVQRLSGINTVVVNNGAVENGMLTVPSWDAVFLRTWTVDAWRTIYFTPTQLTDSAISGDAADPDIDGFSNIQEYVAGTNPTNALSKFQFAGDISSNEIQMNWSSVSGRVYNIYWTTNLTQGFQPLKSSISWPQSKYTVPLSNGVDLGFYQIRVQKK